MKITRLSLAALGLAALLSSGSALAAPATGYSLFGDAGLVAGNGSPTGAEISSDADAPNYGGIDFAVPAGLTFQNLSILSADYKFTAGGCGVGSPRFQVNVIDPNTNTEKNIFVYVGPYPNYNSCALNTWQNTGDLLAPGQVIDTGQLTGGGFYQSYVNAVANFGAYEVVGVQLVADSSWSFAQTVDFDNVVVGSAKTTFESADSCKNNGWKTMVGTDGPYKNQGACVSYFARGGQ